MQVLLGRCVGSRLNMKLLSLNYLVSVLNHDFPSQRPQQHRYIVSNSIYRDAFWGHLPNRYSQIPLAAEAIAKSGRILSSRWLANIVIITNVNLHHIYHANPFILTRIDNMQNARGVIRRTHARMRTCIHY